MELTLTLPCWYAYDILKGYMNSSYTEIQLDRVYGLETEISDFKEFIETFISFHEYAWDGKRDDDDYVTFEYVLKESKEELLNQLVNASVGLITNPGEDSYEQRQFRKSREEYEKRLSVRKSARARYNSNSLLKWFLEREYVGNSWCDTYCDDLDYEYKKYICGRITLEEASANAYSEKWYRKRLGLSKD